MIYVTLALCFVISVLITPLVKKLAIRIGATDQPNHRKVHQKVMPRMGGLAIFISFVIGMFVYMPESEFFYPILIGSAIIVITGILDDMMELSAKVKLIGQIAAAAVVVFNGVFVEFINVPLIGEVNFGFLAIPLTIIWIVGITNAINLIDGLDGLAAGVSSIALVTISGMAIFMGNDFVAAVGLILLGSTLGFLIYNFHPAKIFMGDTGAMFLGFIISVLSLLGFKNVTLVSLIIPIIILGVPISDTIFAIIRRLLNKQPLSAADKSHLHHCLLQTGYSHRQTVLIIYGIAAFFGLAAVLFSQTTLWISITIMAVLLVIVELFAEKIGLMGENHRPLLKYFQSESQKSR